MTTKIGFVSPNQEIHQQITRLYQKDIAIGEVLLLPYSSCSLSRDAAALVSQGAEALISRGTIVDDLETLHLGIPVIRIETTADAVLKAILTAGKLGDSVVYLSSYNPIFHLEDWQNIINFPVEIIPSATDEEVSAILDRLKLRHKHPVIVGGPLSVQKARGLGFTAVMIETLDISIETSYNYARQIIKDLHEKSRQNLLLDHILNHVSEGIMVLDKSENMEYTNRLMKEWFPDSGELSDIFSRTDTHTLHNFIVERGDTQLSLDTFPLEIGQHMTGTLCISHDIPKLQKMEETLRYKMNKKGLLARYTFEDIFTQNTKMHLIIEKAKKYAASDQTIIIYGASGTGKEILAQSIHNASPRKNAPFVAVNCAALSESLLESELFGYEEGAFTGARKQGKPGLFELAHNGTIFLDEINSMSLSVQAKILRVIEEKEVMRIGSDRVIPLNIRIMVATNENLYGQVEKGAFRKDLFYRLNVLDLDLPNLSERKEDILPLLKLFSVDVENMDASLKKQLQLHDWPGNIRELKNFAEKYRITGEETTCFIHSYNSGSGELSAMQGHVNLKDITGAIENAIITILLDHGFSKQEIAEILGISRTSLWKKANRDASQNSD